MRDRANQAAVDTWNDDSPRGKTVAGLADKFIAFAASEVRLALRPREQSPELAEAERWLSRTIQDVESKLSHLVENPAQNPKVIANELDRLRAELASERHRSMEALDEEQATSRAAVAEAVARCRALEGELAQTRERMICADARNRVASDSIVEKTEEIARLQRELGRRLTCKHLEGTPEGTEVCYLNEGHVFIMGRPEEGSDHNCDEMGCGSVGDHVLRIIDTAELAQARGGAQRTVYTEGGTPDGSVLNVLDQHHFSSPEAVTDCCDVASEYIYAVTLTARKVET